MKKVISKSISIQGDIIGFTEVSRKGNEVFRSSQYFNIKKPENIVPSLKELIEDFIGKEEETPKKEKETVHDLPYYLNLINQKYGIDVKKIPLNGLLPMVLKEIAIHLDSMYPDHISNSPRIYAISSVEGRIIEIPKDCIRSYKGFAAFRTLSDALVAMGVIKDLWNNIFNNG